MSTNGAGFCSTAQGNSICCSHFPHSKPHTADNVGHAAREAMNMLHIAMLTLLDSETAAQKGGRQYLHKGCAKTAGGQEPTLKTEGW